MSKRLPPDLSSYLNGVTMPDGKAVSLNLHDRSQSHALLKALNLPPPTWPEPKPQIAAKPAEPPPPTRPTPPTTEPRPAPARLMPTVVS